MESASENKRIPCIFTMVCDSCEVRCSSTWNVQCCNNCEVVTGYHVCYNCLNGLIVNKENIIRFDENKKVYVTIKIAGYGCCGKCKRNYL